MLALGDKTAQSENSDELVHVVGIIGQSQMEGLGHMSEFGEDPPDFKLDRCVILDKFKRPNYKTAEVNDAEQGGEAHSWRALTPGFAPGGDVDPYPWLSPSADPFIGPEMELASNWCRHRRGKLAIIKLAIGGSQVAYDAEKDGTWSAEHVGSGSYLNTYERAYWAYGLYQLAQEYGAENIRILGVASLIGFSDSRTDDTANAFEANMGATIDRLRGYIKPSDPNSVPWLVVQSPLPNFVGNMEIVRAAQLALGNKPGVSVVDSDGFDQLPDEHFSAEGNRQLGALIARFFRGQTGIQPD